jgi:hypothetical protein
LSDVLQDLGQGLTALGTNWAKYSIVGSFLLYLTGYLAVRFHLTAIGIGTDLSVLDERYVFGGARFVVYLVSALPIVFLVLLPVAGIVSLLAKVMTSLTARLRRSWLGHPVPVVWTAVVVAVLVIQGVMRQCLYFHDLLLARDLPAYPEWLVSLLLDDTYMPLYFGALVVACSLSLVVLFALRRVHPRHDAGAMKTGKALLAFLAAVQILLLPVNYGVLIMDKTFARVSAIGTQHVAEDTWLAWEGKEGVTFLVRQPDGTRLLRTVPRDEAKKLDIAGFDPIVPTLFQRH